MKAKKRFGQNFLTDKNLLEKIVRVADIKDKCVLEIGPGKGALTHFLASESKKFLAYEIDLDLSEYLEGLNLKNSKIIFKDFLETDIKQDIREYFNNDDVHLVGNLPYYITSPIVFKFLDTDQLKSATIMVQKEVGLRMTGKPNTKNYNALSVILQFLTDVKIVMNVSRKLFNPIPKVDSVVVQLTKKNHDYDDNFTRLFKEIVKASFAHKRKTLVNNLISKYDVEKSLITSYLDSKNLPDQVRAESLTLEQFIGLTNHLNIIKTQ